MDLRQFVATALEQIIGAVHDAQPKVEGYGGVVNPRPNWPNWEKDAPADVLLYQDEPGDGKRRLLQEVEFDVALTVTETEGKEAGIAVVAGILGGGGKGKKETASGSVSHIRFKIPIGLPGKAKTD